MIELNDPSKNFEVTHPSGAVFVLKHWTMGMQEEVEKRCVVIGEDAKNVQYLTALDRQLKIEFSLVGWRGVTVDGREVEFSPERAKQLPMGVLFWLQKTIEERAGLRIGDSEKKN